VKFEPGELDLPHERASSEFSVSIVRPPEHRLTICAAAETRPGAERSAVSGDGRRDDRLAPVIANWMLWRQTNGRGLMLLELDQIARFISTLPAVIPPSISKSKM
jgi:hypothetical protein